MSSVYLTHAQLDRSIFHERRCSFCTACNALASQPQNALSLPDANSRLQAVIAGNGLAVMDSLAEPDIERGNLVWISEIALTNFAYCVVPPTNGKISMAAATFRNWIKAQDF